MPSAQLRFCRCQSRDAHLWFQLDPVTPAQEPPEAQSKACAQESAQSRLTSLSREEDMQSEMGRVRVGAREVSEETMGCGQIQNRPLLAQRSDNKTKG